MSLPARLPYNDFDANAIERKVNVFGFRALQIGDFKAARHALHVYRKTTHCGEIIYKEVINLAAF